MTDTGQIDVANMIAAVRDQGAVKPFGWRSIDALELGVNPGELTVIAGRPGHGKTTVLLNILVHWLESHPSESFILYSHEVPAESVMIKLLCMFTRSKGARGWSYNEMREWLHTTGGTVPRGLESKDAQRAVERLSEFQKRLFVIYQPDWNTLELARSVGAIAHKTGTIGGIFVDYLQLVPGPPGHYENREHEVSVVAKQLKRLAVETRCPLVAAAQIGREAAYAAAVIPSGSLEDERVLREIAKRRPQLHHLREGGGEQEADFVVGILNYRADFVSIIESKGLDMDLARDMGDATPFDFCVIKNRFGRIATVPLVLEARNGLIRDQGVFGN